MEGCGGAIFAVLLSMPFPTAFIHKSILKRGKNRPYHSPPPLYPILCPSDVQRKAGDKINRTFNYAFGEEGREVALNDPQESLALAKWGIAGAFYLQARRHGWFSSSGARRCLLQKLLASRAAKVTPLPESTTRRRRPAQGDRSFKSTCQSHCPLSLLDRLLQGPLRPSFRAQKSKLFADLQWWWKALPRAIGLAALLLGCLTGLLYLHDATGEQAAQSSLCFSTPELRGGGVFSGLLRPLAERCVGLHARELPCSTYKL